MLRSLQLHPVLWALCPILFLYAHNYPEITPETLIFPVGITIACTLLLCGLLVWRIHDRVKAAVIASWIVIFTFLYGHIYGLIPLGGHVIASWPLFYFILWLIILLGVSLLLARSSYNLAWLSSGLDVAAIVFTVYLVVITGRLEFIRYTQLGSAPRVKMQQQQLVENSQNYPDIYYIILDAHIRSDGLKMLFGGNNSDFIDSLRKKGFYVADRSRSNYSATITSLPSSLNMSYLTEVAQRVGAKSGDRAPLRAMIANPVVCQVLRAHGYKVAALPSEYDAVKMKSDVSMTSLQDTPDFYAAVMNTTPLLLLSLLAEGTSFDPYAVHRDFVLRQFEALSATAKQTRSEPLFLFAHILAPHQPLVFAANGAAVKADMETAIKAGRHWRNDSMRHDEYVRKYREEIRYIDKRADMLADDILAHARRPAVIIFQGDHGAGFIPDGDDYSHMNLQERFSILNAYHLPDGGNAALYPTITPVNTFRIVLNRYLRTHYALLKDESFFSGFLRPYNFQNVTATLDQTPMIAQSVEGSSQVGGD